MRQFSRFPHNFGVKIQTNIFSILPQNIKEYKYSKQVSFLLSNKLNGFREKSGRETSLARVKAHR